MTFGDFRRGKCSFAIKPRARFLQSIDLRLYSLLIDTGLAILTASALMGCDIPGNHAYLSVLMQRSDGLAQGNRSYLSNTRITYLVFVHYTLFFILSGSDKIKLDDKFVMQPYQIAALRIMKYTRQISITFGVETLPSPGTWCYFDNMTLGVRHTI